MFSRIFCLRVLFVYFIRTALIGSAVFYLAFVAQAQPGQPGAPSVQPTPFNQPPTVVPTPPVVQPTPPGTLSPNPTTPNILSAPAPTPSTFEPSAPPQTPGVLSTPLPSATPPSGDVPTSGNQNTNVQTTGAPSSGVSPNTNPIPLDNSPRPDSPEFETAPVPRDPNGVAPEEVPGVPTIAPGFSSSDRGLPEIGRVGVDLMNQRLMTLREALELALTNNKDIEVARDNVRVSEFDFTAAGGIYEPRFFLQSFYERAVTPTASLFQGGADGSVTQTNFANNAQAQGFEPRFGGNYLVQFNNSRLTTNNLFTNLNPQYTTNLFAQYTQPILRGRRFDANRRAIEISRRNLSLTDVQFRQRTIEVITNVQRAYWDLAYSLKNLQVQRDAVRDARDQLEHNQRLVREGILAPIDIVQSETQVANFETNVFAALDEVARAENNLKNLIAQNRNDALWGAAILPTDPVDNEPPPTSLPDAMTEAMANRPELEQSEAAIAINEIDRRFFREQTKPQVDLVANVNLAGLAGTENLNGGLPFGSTDQTPTINALINQINQINGQIGRTDTLTPLEIPPTNNLGVPDNLRGGYFNSIGNLAAARYPTFRLGVQINLPFASRTAKAQLGRSLVEGERLQTQREQIEQLVQVDVRNSLQLLRTSQARLRAAAIARENSERQYASEQRKLDAGQSTVFLVLERQTALTNARGAELRAQTEINKAIAELQRATGNSLRSNNIVASAR